MTCAPTDGEAGRTVLSAILVANGRARPSSLPSSVTFSADAEAFFGASWDLCVRLCAFLHEMFGNLYLIVRRSRQRGKASSQPTASASSRTRVPVPIDIWVGRACGHARAPVRGHQCRHLHGLLQGQLYSNVSRHVNR